MYRISFGALRFRLWSRRPFSYFWYCWCPRFAKRMWRKQRRKHVLHGPVMGRMSCVAWPARKAGAARCAQVRSWPFHSVWRLSACSHGRWTLRWWFVCHLASCVWHPSRPKGRLFWMPPPVCAHSCDPLLGGGGKGGSRATNRQQAQRDDIAALSAALAAKVDNLQALVSSSLGSPGPKQRGSMPDNPQPNQSVSSVPSLPASGHSQSSLCGRFGALCSEFQSGPPASDAALRSALWSLLAEDSPNTSLPDAGPACTWADVAKTQPKPRSALSLYRDAWTDPITKASKVQEDCDGKSRRVLECQNSSQRENVLRWASACGNHDGSLASFCVVMFDSGQASSSGTAVSVLVHGLQGPRQQSATVEVFGGNPPRLKPLPSSFRNDLAATKAEIKTVVLRLTLAKEFSHATLFQEAERGPHFLPSLLLNPRKLVLQTRAAIAYRSEVTCLIRVSESEASGLLARLPTETFISRHHAGDRPHWVPRPPGASSGDYLAAAKGFAAASGGRPAPALLLVSLLLNPWTPPCLLVGTSPVPLPFGLRMMFCLGPPGGVSKTSPTSSATATKLGFSLPRSARANALLPFKAASLCL